MKAFVIAAETITDATMFDEYRKAVPDTLTAFGGRLVVRGGAFTVLEGEWSQPRVVIIEFPSRADAEAWYASSAYQAIIGLRHKSSVGSLIIIDGPA